MKSIEVQGIVIEIARKKMKNLRLSVKPPLGDVRLSAPHRVSMERIRTFINTHLDWIKTNQAKYQGELAPKINEYVSGETHLYQGKLYVLEVFYQASAPKVVLTTSKIQLYAREGSETEVRQKILTEWYRTQLKSQVPLLIAKWEKVIGVKANEWGIKQMKTKWGTCNIDKKRIWVNLELAQKPLQCLEYIIVHELVHLLERYHNARFHGFMDKFLPNWRDCKKALNSGAMGAAHEVD